MGIIPTPLTTNHHGRFFDRFRLISGLENTARAALKMKAEGGYFAQQNQKVGWPFFWLRLEGHPKKSNSPRKGETKSFRAQRQSKKIQM